MSDKYDAIQMDPLIMSAARAPAAGDPIAALNLVAFARRCASTCASRHCDGAAWPPRSSEALLRSAARAFGPKEAVARARCVVAESEIALVSRDLAGPRRRWNAARVTLEEHGDWLNAAHARERATEGAEMRAHIGS